MNRATIVLCVLFVSGCEGVSPSSFKVAAPQTIFVEQNHWSRTYGSYVANYELTPGPYRARWEDSGGTYFEGPRFCFRSHNVGADLNENQRLPGARSCGVYLPRAAGEEPKVWVTGAGVVLHPDGSVTEGITGSKVDMNSSEAPSSTGYMPAPGLPPTNSAQVIGGALGTAAVSVIIEAEQKNVRLLRDMFQPPKGMLRQAIRNG